MYSFRMAAPLKDYYKQELQEKESHLKKYGIVKKEYLHADEVMKSPGIPEKNDMVKKIRAKGIPVISEIELAYRYKGESKIIGITGSNGKTTTTAMTHHICKHGGLGLCTGREYWVFFCPAGSRRPETMVYRGNQQFSAG